MLGRILSDLFAWFDNVSDFLIGFNTAAWMSETGVVTTEGSLFPVSDPPGALPAFLILLAYILVLGAATFWLFQRGWGLSDLRKNHPHGKSAPLRVEQMRLSQIAVRVGAAAALGLMHDRCADPGSNGH